MDSHQLRQEARLLSPNAVFAELLALSIAEFSYMRTLSIIVDLESSGAQICDSGRGIRLSPDPGETISHAESVFTNVNPSVPSSQEIESALRGLIWGERGSCGPALPNAACPSLRFISDRGGEKWTQIYRYGTPVGPVALIGSTDTTGTTIRFETAGLIDHAAVGDLIGELRARIPDLSITLRCQSIRRRKQTSTHALGLPSSNAL
jgi:DNA gyrase/topoisomerase IV subunit B